MAIKLYTGVFQPDTQSMTKIFDSPSGPVGNTKTANMVFDAIEAVKSGAIVFTNFKTTSPLGRPFTRCMSFKEAVKIVKYNSDFIEEKNFDVYIFITEAWKVYGKYLNSDDEEALREFDNRMRHYRIRLVEDTQRYRDLPTVLRDAVTEILLPHKVHDNGEVCNDPYCEQHHISVVRKVLRDGYNNWVEEEVRRFDIDKVLPYYNARHLVPIPEPGGVLFD
jgi:hypothetical protein